MAHELKLATLLEVPPGAEVSEPDQEVVRSHRSARAGWAHDLWRRLRGMIRSAR
jgi:hypothetical protein